MVTKKRVKKVIDKNWKSWVHNNVKVNHCLFCQKKISFTEWVAGSGYCSKHRYKK